MTYLVQQRSSVVDLGSPDWPAGADFLRLRLTVTYSFLWKLRKPERMQLEITQRGRNPRLSMVRAAA